jgi:outer membrane lipase/esterase
MRKFRMSIIAGAVTAALAAGPAAAQYSNFYFFGDSLTDAGSYKPVLPAPLLPLFTTNPGPVWAQALGSRYGFTITPANQGGTDYAYGGARVTLQPGNPPAPPTGAAVPIATQVQNAVAKGVDSNAAYFLWGGPNDIAVQATAYLSGQISQAQLQTNVATAATQFAQQVAVLQNAGARYVIVLNLPDIGKTPYALSQGPAVAGALSSLSDLYNSTQLATLTSVGGNQVRVNITTFFNEILANPSAYGFANVKGSACVDVNNLFACNPSTLVAPNAAQTYLFADGYHPTTGGHAAIAQLVASMLEGPAQIGTMSGAPLAVEQAQFRALDGRMWSSLGTPGGSSLQTWVSYDYGSNDFGGGSLGTGNSATNSVAAGLDLRLTNEVLAGVAFGYSEDKADFGNSAGNFKLQETMITAYGGWGRGPWYVGGSAFLGNLDYSTTRNFAIGTATRSENGDTGGTHWGIRLLGGYWFNYQNIVHGPFLKLVYQEATVGAFSENSSDSTALRYQKQERDSFITSLGWQAQGQWGPVRPFARATWEWESKDSQQYVTASSSTLGGSYSVATYKPDGNWGLFLLGASMDFGKVTGFVSGSATAGKGNGDGYGITVGVRVPL